MKKSIALIILHVYFISYSFSQSQMVYNKTIDESFLLRYEQVGNTYLNQMIQELATANRVSTSSISMTFSYSENFKIYKRGDNLNLISELKNLEIEGNIMYKDFPVKKFFIPEKVSFELECLNRNILIGNLSIQNAILKGNPITIADVNLIDTLNNNAENENGRLNNYKLISKNKAFNYTVVNKSKFDAYTSLIKNYYTENTTAKAKLRSIVNIKSDKNSLLLLSDFNKLYEYRDLSQKNLNYALDVEKKDFYRNLPLNENDPVKLVSKISRIKNISKELNKNSIELLNSLDEVYYNKGVEMLAQNNPAQADIYFNKSLEINQNYVPSHLKLAKIYYNSGRVDRAMQKIMQIKDMSADGYTKTEIVNFAGKMYDDFIIEANYYNNRDNFDGALSALSQASKICKGFAQIACRQKLDQEYSRAINGKYFLILSDIDIQISKGRLTEAEKIISIALDYRRQNIEFIPGNQDIAIRINNLYFAYIDNGNRFNSTAYYDRALTEFNDAERICNTYLEINCTKELSNGYFDSRSGIYNRYINKAQKQYQAKNYSEADKSINTAISYRNKYAINKNTRENQLNINIKQAYYNEFITKGLEASNNKKYTKAISYFNEAKKIESQFSIRKNTKLSSYIKSAAKNLILKKINEGHKKVDYNDLTAARKYFTEARELQSNYSLVNDIKVINAISGLKERIFKQECINAQNKYDAFYNDALTKITLKDYVSADNLLTKAINQANKFSQCMMDTRSVQNKKTEIAPAVKFIKQINSANDYIRRSSFLSAINLYEETYDYFTTAKIANFGISCDNTFDWIQKQSSDFVNYSIDYYINKQEDEKALSSLKTLRARNFNAKRTKISQVNLANALVLRDYKENPTGNAYENISRYIGTDKYYKYFMKAYKKQWKKIKKNR